MTQSRRFPGWLSYLIVMLIAAVLAGLFWKAIRTSVAALDRATQHPPTTVASSATSSPQTVTVTAAPVISRRAPEKSPSTFKLLIEASDSALPMVSDVATDRIYIFLPEPPTSASRSAQGLIFGNFPIPRGKLIRAYRCRLANYGEEPLINVEMPVDLLYTQLFGDSASAGTRDERPRRVETILIPSIAPGADRAVVFYALNLDPHYQITATFPSAVTCQLVGNSARRTVALSHAGLNWIGLFPPHDA